jgi:hypothetical protein
VLEFYDLNGGFIASEVGRADTAPIVKAHLDMLKEGRLTDVVSALRPDLPIPDSVVALQTKLLTAEPSGNSVTLSPSQESVASLTLSSSAGGATASQQTGTGVAGGSLPPIVGSSGGGGASGAAGAQSGGQHGILPDDPCSNGCCDASWTANLCDPGFAGADYQWYLFDYGNSFANSGSADVHEFWGAACAAIGTSTWVINSNPHGGTWSVNEGTYRWYYFNNGNDQYGHCYVENTATNTSVNTSSNPHLHTYCGGFWYCDG